MQAGKAVTSSHWLMEGHGELLLGAHVRPANAQADEIQRLQERIAELESTVKMERRRADLYCQQVQQCQQLMNSKGPLAQTGPCMRRSRNGNGLPDDLQFVDARVRRSVSLYMNLTGQQTNDSKEQQEGPQEEYITITKKEYELLLLKDQAISVLQEGITIADCSLPDMPLIFANTGFSTITGYSWQETLGYNCRFLQGEGTDKETVDKLRDAIKHGRACAVQLMNYKKNGDPFVNYLSLTPIHDSTGKMTHFVGIQSDITELVNHQKAELAAKHAALQAAAATEAKSQFLARMSHEIRTPLNGMIAVGQLLAETSLSPAQWDLVNTIRCSGETLLMLITDILDFSRIEANKMVLHHSLFKLDTVVEAAMEIAGLRAAQKRLQVAYHISADTPRMLLGDAQRLQQVLLNIVNNAVKFTEQGQVLLEVWSEEVAEGGQLPAPPATKTAALLAPDKACKLMFSVRDTGIGISSTDLGKLFSSFTQVDTSPTRRYGGSGLGLAISKKLCEAMAGTMWVESPGLGKGSTFHWNILVRLPREMAAPGQQHPLTGVRSQPSSRRSSLLLGDSPPELRSGLLVSSLPAAPDARLALAEQKPSRLSKEVQRSDSSEGEAVDAVATLRAGKATSSPATVLSALPLSSDSSAEAGSNVASTAPPKPPAAAAAAAHNINPLLAGKKVLMVEPCTMIRQVLSLALASWGCHVCAVESQEGALEQLAAAGTLPEDAMRRFMSHASAAPSSLAPYKPATRDAADAAGGRRQASPLPPPQPDLHLRTSDKPSARGFDARGPYDIILMDLLCTRLLHAVSDCLDDEAQRLVFMAWPGQSDLEAEALEPSSSSGGDALGGVLDEEELGNMGTGLTAAAVAAAAVATSAAAECTPGPGMDIQAALKAVTEEISTRPSRQLGYVIVTRPVRQGRLMLALEEVLAMQLNEPLPSAPEHASGGEALAMGSVRSGVSGAATTDGASSAAPEVADLPPHLHPFSMSGAALSAGSVAAGVRPGAHPLARQPSQGMAQEAGARRFHDDHSSTSSSRATYSHGAEELGGMSGTGQLSLGNSTLRPATMIKNSNSGGNLPDLASTASNGTLSILLVEDNAINMKVALGILRRFGQNEVKTAYDGQQALRTVDANGGADAFHLILMDLHMPVMGGMEALREFKTRYPCSTTKVVAVTADAFEVTRDECMSAGFDGWLPKPFRLEDMVRIIGENVGGSASNNPSAAPTNKSGKL